MSASDLFPWVIGLYGFLGTVLLALLATMLRGGYWLRGKFAGFEHRFTEAQRSIAALGRSIETQIQLTGTVIGALRRQSILGDSDLTEIERLYMQGNMRFILQTVGSEEQKQNPLSNGELQRLKSYINKAERGDIFNIDEIQEYRKLVAKLEEDRGGVDPGVVALVGLGALLLGIWLGSQTR